MNSKKQESLFWGVVLLLVGALFLLDNLGLDIDIWDVLGDFWPMILILIGLKNIWYHFNKNKSLQKEE